MKQIKIIFLEGESQTLRTIFLNSMRRGKEKKSGTTIGTKYALPYTCICMDAVEAEFPMSQYLQLFLWLCYIDGIYFKWTHGKEHLFQLFNKFNNLLCNLGFTCENVNFLKLTWKLKTCDNTYRLLHQTKRWLPILPIHHLSHLHHIKLSIPHNQVLKE